MAPAGGPSARGGGPVEHQIDLPGGQDGSGGGVQIAEPCVAEIPQLNQLATSYQDKDVVFLGLTTDNEAKVQSFIKKKPFAFNLLPNSFSILLKYAEKDGNGNINMGYPTHFLINQKGEIELKTDGFDKIELLKSNIIRLLPKNSVSSQIQTTKK